MEGRETELDKTILEAIKDPLTHLVRNAVDHGIEAAETRARRRQAGRGRADPARLPRGRPGHHRGRRRRRAASTRPSIGAKAVERGLVTAEQLDRMSPTRDPAADLPARLLHRRRRSPTSPAAASAWTSSRPTSRRSAAPSTSSPTPGAGTTLPAHDPADAGDHPGADRRVRRRPLRHPAGQPAGAGPPRRREGRQRGRGGRRRAGLPAARQAAAAGPAHRRPRARPPSRHDGARRHRRAAGRGPPVRPGRRPGHQHRGDRRQAARRPAEGDRPVLRRHDPRRRHGRADPRRPGAGPPGAAHRDRASGRSPRGRAPRPAAPPRPSGSACCWPPSAAAGGWRSRWPRSPGSRRSRTDAVEQVGNREVVQYRGEILPMVRLDRHLGAYGETDREVARGHRLHRPRPQRRASSSRRSSTSSTARPRSAATSTTWACSAPPSSATR